MQTITMLMMAATVVKIVGTIKAVGKDNNFVLTQLVTWGVGIVLLFLAAHAQVFNDLAPLGEGSTAIGDYDAASIILAGLVLGSTGAFAYDWKKARDGSDSAAEPPLVRSMVPVPDPALSPPVTPPTAGSRLKKKT